MKKYWPFALILIGIMMILMGFVYDVLFAGIPYQDPTPEMIANYNLHSQIAATIRWMGVRVCFVGGGVFVMRGLISKLRALRA